jgi:hypothetical protein
MDNTKFELKDNTSESKVEDKTTSNGKHTEQDNKENIDSNITINEENTTTKTTQQLHRSPSYMDANILSGREIHNPSSSTSSVDELNPHLAGYRSPTSSTPSYSSSPYDTDSNNNNESAYINNYRDNTTLYNFNYSNNNNASLTPQNNYRQTSNGTTNNQYNSNNENLYTRNSDCSKLELTNGDAVTMEYDSPYHNNSRFRFLFFYF